MKKATVSLYLIAILGLMSPVVASAAWWNPFSWFDTPVTQPVFTVPASQTKYLDAKPVATPKPVLKIKAPVVSDVSNIACIGDICYKVISTSVLQKSVDAGLTWFDLVTQDSNGASFPVGDIKNILCKTDLECFAVGAERSIFHTIDGWQTMTIQNLKIDEPIKAINTDGNVVYIVDGQFSDTPQKVARFDFKDISILADGSIAVDDFVSKDNGLTWVSTK